MMNIKIGETNITVSVWYKFAGYVLLTIAGLLLYRHFTVAFNAKSISQLAEGVEALKIKSARYHDFISVSRKTLQEKDKTEILVSRYMNVMSGAAKSQNSFLAQINEVADQSKIELDKLEPQEGIGGKSWSLSFTADYKSICNFFNLLEQYFKIETFSISGGELGGKPEKVSARLSALAPKISAIGSGDDNKREIFDLYFEVEELLKNIEAKEAESLSIQLAKTYDPMSLSDTIFLPEKKQEEAKKIVVPKPPVKIESIFWDPVTPVVVIAGEGRKEGEEIKGVTIEKIYENSVTVSWKGKKYELKKKSANKSDDDDE
jgi:hypothetical protein